MAKGTKHYRFSNRKESGLHPGTYMFNKSNDAQMYYRDAKNTSLGFKSYDKLYASKIEQKSDIRVRRGRAMVEDFINQHKDTKLKEAFDYLDSVGYLDDTKSSYERFLIWDKDKKAEDYRKTLANSINKGVYDSTKTSDKVTNFIDKYKNLKYDAVVDPEDFMWNYEQPMIIINDKKFKRTKQDVVYNHSVKEFEEYYDKQKAEGRSENDIYYSLEDLVGLQKVFETTPKEKKAIDKKLKDRK